MRNPTQLSLQLQSQSASLQLEEESEKMYKQIYEVFETFDKAVNMIEPFLLLFYAYLTNDLTKVRESELLLRDKKYKEFILGKAVSQDVYKKIFLKAHEKLMLIDKNAFNMKSTVFFSIACLTGSYGNMKKAANLLEKKGYIDFNVKLEDDVDSCVIPILQAYLNYLRNDYSTSSKRSLFFQPDPNTTSALSKILSEMAIEIQQNRVDSQQRLSGIIQRALSQLEKVTKDIQHDTEVAKILLKSLDKLCGARRLKELHACNQLQQKRRAGLI